MEKWLEMSRADMFGRKFVKCVLALCNDKLWPNGGYHANRHSRLHCSGRQIIKNQEPSGANPTEIGICTCACHTKTIESELHDNFLAWKQRVDEREEKLARKVADVLDHL